LQLGIYTVGDTVDYLIPCEHRRTADLFVEQLAQHVAWPKNDVARLELWPDETPLVLRMENVYSATVNSCADYRAYRRSMKDLETTEEEETAAGPDQIGEPEPQKED